VELGWGSLATALWWDFSWTAVFVSVLAGGITCLPNLYLTSVVLHRGLCHRAIIYPRWLQLGVICWLWLTVCVTPLTWVAAHLHHHSKSDTAEDPHAPNVKGFWHVTLLTWYYVPLWMSSNLSLANKLYLKHLRHEKLLHILNHPRVAGANFYGQMILSLLLGPLAIAFWCSRIVPYMVFSGYFNAASHSVGARIYDNLGTDARGFRQTLIGYILGGESLGHNYHHAHPGSAAVRPSGFDPGFWFATRVLRGRPRFT